MKFTLKQTKSGTWTVKFKTSDGGGGFEAYDQTFEQAIRLIRESHFVGDLPYRKSVE